MSRQGTTNIYRTMTNITPDVSSIQVVETQTSLVISETNSSDTVLTIFESDTIEIHDGTIVQIIDSNTSSSETTIFEQNSASSFWIINHNLNKYPSVSVVDSAGSLIDGEAKYVSANRIELTFSQPFSGKAYLN